MADTYYAVYFTDANNGWAAGVSGITYHTTNGGASWSAQTSGTTDTIRNVVFTDANNGWATGANGTILHTTNGGANWSAQTSGTAEYIFDCFFLDGSNGWAVGSNGALLHYSGSSMQSGVSVSAEVPAPAPTLTFTVAVESTPTGGSMTDSTISFGELEANIAKTGTHRLSVTTNEPTGYTVTAAEAHTLRSGSNNVPDSLGDNGTMSAANTANWSNSSTYGFGYNMANVIGADAAFTDTTGTPEAYRAFANEELGQAPQTIMSNSGTVTNNQVDITYKANVGPSQAQGSYSNTIEFIATGNF
jgi:hypothetical protein